MSARRKYAQFAICSADCAGFRNGPGGFLYESGSIESLWPPLHRLMKPAEPPLSTAPRAKAALIRASIPSFTQRSTANCVLPPLMRTMSAAAKAAPSSLAEGDSQATCVHGLPLDACPASRRRDDAAASGDNRRRGGARPLT